MHNHVVANSPLRLPVRLSIMDKADRNYTQAFEWNKRSHCILSLAFQNPIFLKNCQKIKILANIGNQKNASK
jgi:hypothetical protein